MSSVPFSLIDSHEEVWTGVYTGSSGKGVCDKANTLFSSLSHFTVVSFSQETLKYIDNS